MSSDDYPIQTANALVPYPVEQTQRAKVTRQRLRILLVSAKEMAVTLNCIRKGKLREHDLLNSWVGFGDAASSKTM
jgi:hypothetical protein